MENRGGEEPRLRRREENVLRVPQAGLYQRDSQPVSALSMTRLNERIRNVAQSRVTTLSDDDDPNQPAPTNTRQHRRHGWLTLQ